MISVKKLAAAGLLGTGLLLGGCAYDQSVYGGASVGYGAPDYYGSGYGYGGWYDDYYYPGSGFYVFNRAGVRYRWNDRQRAYWESHRGDRGGWHGGPRRANGDYDGRRWNRDGRPDGQTVDRDDRRDRGDRADRGDRRRDRAGGATPAPTEGRGFRGDRGGRAVQQGQAASQPRQAREPRPSQSSGRERREEGGRARDQ